MTLRKSGFRAMLAAGLLAVTGLGVIPQQVQALTFNAGDAVLVLYGNGTEYYRNLGSASAIPSSVTINSSFLSQLGSPSTIEYTIIGANAANFGVPSPVSTFEGSAIPSTNTSVTTGWTATRNGSINQQQYWNTIVNWNGQVATVVPNPGESASEHVLASSDTRSFSTFFGTADRLNGSFPLRMSANIENALFLLGRNFLPVGNQTAQSALGQALLTAQVGGGAQLNFTPAVVPIPAAVILFGSGLVGLIGIARRKFAQA